MLYIGILLSYSCYLNMSNKASQVILLSSSITKHFFKTLSVNLETFIPGFNLYG